MLDVRKLRLLRELAHRATIAAVAEALCYSPSAVSQQLAALEREVGVPLLRRSGRRVTLTPAGAALAEQTEAGLAPPGQAASALPAPPRPPTRPPASAENPAGGHGDARWIMGSRDTLCHVMAVRACQAAGFTPRIRHHADDFATVLALVAAGQGVALVPQLGAIDPPAGVALTALPTRRRTRIAYRRGARHRPSASACIASTRASP